MTLMTWMKLNNLTVTECAVKFGVTPSMVHKYLYDNAIPQKSSMEKIYRATKGLVDANEFYGLSSFSFDPNPANDNEDIYQGERYDE